MVSNKIFRNIDRDDDLCVVDVEATPLHVSYGVSGVDGNVE